MTNLERSLAGPDDRILITGAAGFIGSRVVDALIEQGFRNLACLVRPSSQAERVAGLARRGRRLAGFEILEGNLQSPADCRAAVKDAVVVLHLAAGRGEKSFPDAVLNSVVTTRNLLEASAAAGRVRRFVSVSSFAVYGPAGRVLDESCALEDRPEQRGDAYCFAKTKQDRLVIEYGSRLKLPFVIVRPGWVYGPGNEPITGRVGLGTFGLFLHLGGPNPLPLTYVDNCADAIVRAGLVPGVDGQAFNVVDDDLPSSREFLRLYKRRVRRFASVYVPHAASYALCWAWERYSHWSEGQLPPVFNRRMWRAAWKKTRYSNEKIKTRLGWTPRVSTADALERYFAGCRRIGRA